MRAVVEITTWLIDASASKMMMLNRVHCSMDEQPFSHDLQVMVKSHGLAEPPDLILS